MTMAPRCGLFFSFPLLLLLNPASSHPLSQALPSDVLMLLPRGDDVKEVNPVYAKFKTIPDEGMPPALDFNVMASPDLSSWDDEAMALRSLIFIPGQYQARVPLANGYIGAAVTAAGPFFEKDVNQTNHPGRESEVKEGWPLWDARQTFSTVSGFYDCQTTTPGTNFPELQALGCESVISGIPHPLALNLIVGDNVLNSTVRPETISNYAQTLKFKDGLSKWQYTWSPGNTEVKFNIEFTSLMSRLRPNVAATQLLVTPRGGNYNATIVDILDGRAAKRSFLGVKGMLPESSTIYVSNHPDGLPDVTAWTVSTVNISKGYVIEKSRRMAPTPGNENNMTIAQQWDVQLLDGETAIFQKFIGVASTDKFALPRFEALTAAARAFSTGWDSILSEHTQTWNDLMHRNLMTSYRDPGTGKLPENDTMIEKLQIAATADRYYILQNLLPEDGAGLNDNGVSVSGLSSDAYGGMLFWDQDIWMYPGIAITNPEYARQIVKSRVKLLPQAKANAQMPYVQEKYRFDNMSALYPWTSGRYGNATSTGPALDYEYHINTDIVLAMFQDLAITGNEAYFQDELWPVAESVGYSIATLLVKDGDGWSIRNMTDPDEYANMVNNGAFTLASMAEVLHRITNLQQKYGLYVNETWIHMANHVNIPRAASGIVQEYEGMLNNVTIKQADVSMLAYPLHWTQNYTLDDRRMDLAYYTQKQTTDGPGMTFAINAIDENLAAKSGCASFTYNLQARFSNYRGPWYQMSEQANDDVNANGGVPPAFPFLTGHGGALQMDPFGYLGLDLTQENLTIQPSLPYPLKHMQIQDFYFNGARLRAVMNSTHTNITRLLTSDTKIQVDIYSSHPMPVVVGSPNGRMGPYFYSLAVSETITVENDMYWQTATTSQNVLQCQTTTSKNENALGQWPGAATDGNAGTRWQPLTRELASLTVDTSTVPYQRVTQINFNWGGRPPTAARVGFTNCSDIQSLDDDCVWQVPLYDLRPSWQGASPNADVAPYIGYRTENKLAAGLEIWTGKYAILEIQGCDACGFPGHEDGLGATVGEFEVIGELGTNLRLG